MTFRIFSVVRLGLPIPPRNDFTAVRDEHHRPTTKDRPLWDESGAAP